MKVVINAKFGGFSLSKKACERLAELGHDAAQADLIAREGISPNHPLLPLLKDSYLSTKIERNDPHLVQVVEELGDEASGRHAKLKIVEIPDDVEWVVEEYDGNEWIAEKHRRWE